MILMRDVRFAPAVIALGVILFAGGCGGGPESVADGGSPMVTASAAGVAANTEEVCESVKEALAEGLGEFFGARLELSFAETEAEKAEARAAGRAVMAKLGTDLEVQAANATDPAFAQALTEAAGLLRAVSLDSPDRRGTQEAGALIERFCKPAGA